MAITRTQIARQLLQFGGGADMGEERAQGRSRDTGGSERDRRRGDKGIGAGRNPRDQFSPRADTEGVNFMDQARRDVNPLGILTELPGAVGTVSRFLTPNPFGFSNPKPFASPDGGASQQISQMPLWAQLGFSSEAEYLASLQAQENTEPESKPEEEGLRLAFRAEGGPIGGEYDFESARQMYGLGKLVKKVTRSVKKIAKSPIGKAAITGYFLGGGSLGGVLKSRPGFSFSNLGSALGFGRLSGGEENIFTGGPFSSVANLVRDKITSTGGMTGLGILGASALAGALTPEEENEAQQLVDNTGIDIEAARNSILAARREQYAMDSRARRFRAEGGSMKEPVAKKTMPLLDMGGQEMDLRAEGGFVPIGRMEKADDVPARLSKNEFVFTADAVRNAGDGDVDKGAEVMYNMMKNLEAGGEVSEESQGLQGARKMFQTSQRLEEVL